MIQPGSPLKKALSLPSLARGEGEQQPLFQRAARTSSAVLLALAAATAFARAASVPPPPDPGLESSARAADLIAEVEILAGGPFRAVASVRRILKGTLSALGKNGAGAQVIELEGFNSLNGDTVHSGFATGTRYLLFLSRTGRAGTYATLTPAAPRLGLNEDGVTFALGDPPFRIPVQPALMTEALALILERGRAGATPEKALPFIQALWDRNEVEPRYLAVALAGYLREPRARAILAEAAGATLLRLRLTAVEALKNLGTPEARALLRELARDEKATVARAAAEALADLRELEGYGTLLAWARKEAEALAKLPQGDARRTPSQRALGKLLNLLDAEGPLLPSERLAPPLFELARLGDDTVAPAALFVLGTLARRGQIQGLLDLADDPVYPLRREAALALFRATLRPTGDLDRFRGWWKEAHDGFGEETLRAAAELAAGALLERPDDDERTRLTNLLRAAPGEIALVSAAPLLLDEKHAALLETTDLLAYRSPLVLPFLLERLGYESDADRRSALDGLAGHALRCPRFRALALPFVRGALCDDYLSIRRTAVVAAGGLEDTRALGALVDALRASEGTFEAAEAARSIYTLTARTLGYGQFEPVQDLELAAQRLTGWWKEVGSAEKDWAIPFSPAPERPAASAEEAAEWERLCLGAESRPCGAAFAALLARRGPSAPFWEKLLDSKRLRDRAHGVLARTGGDAAQLASLTGLLVSASEGDLVKAHALPALCMLPGGGGAAWVAGWLDGAGAQAGLPWRRLATVCLGLAEGEPKSLAWLTHGLELALAAEDPDKESTPPEGAPDFRPLRRAALAALCARGDSNAALAKALRSKSFGVRETAARALSLRRCREAADEVLGALAKSDRYSVADLVRAAEPLVQARNIRTLRAMLDSADDPTRVAGANLLARRWDLAGETDTRASLIVALKDTLPAVRARAAETLGKLRVRAAVPNLVPLLADDDSEARACAAEALAAIGDREGCALAANEARRQFRLDPRWLRAIALSATETDLDLLLKFSHAATWLDQRVSIDALGFCPRPEALARLLEVFRDDDSPFQTHAADALAVQGPAVVDVLGADLDAPQPATRARALQLLARIHHKSAVERLVKALRDRDPGLRVLADWALRRLSGGLDAGYDPDGTPGQLEAVAQRWRALITPEVLKAQAAAAGR